MRRAFKKLAVCIQELAANDQFISLVEGVITQLTIYLIVQLLCI